MERCKLENSAMASWSSGSGKSCWALCAAEELAGEKGAKGAKGEEEEKEEEPEKEVLMADKGEKDEAEEAGEGEWEWDGEGGAAPSRAVEAGMRATPKAGE